MEEDSFYYERLCKRIDALESVIRTLGPVEDLLERIVNVEKTLYAGKDILSSKEAAEYLGLKASTLYKLTYNNEIPFYKPNGKNIFFKREDLREWLQQGYNSSGCLIHGQAGKMEGEYYQEFTNAPRGKKRG